MPKAETLAQLASLKKNARKLPEDGTAVAAAQLRAKLKGVLDDPPQPSPGGNQASDGDTDAKRAARGTVLPLVIGALRENPQGLRPREIAEKTGLNENSVRGLLNRLATEGKTTKVGDSWILAPENGKPGH